MSNTISDPKKIVIIGPESTGKTALSAALAAHYKTGWVPEYAREYLTRYGRNYTYQDLIAIAEGQLALEDKLLAGLENNMIFIDTNMYVMKVWFQVAFGKVPDFVEKEIRNREYDLYLLANVDLPWTADELREYPDFSKRLELFTIYRGILEQQAVPWEKISGQGEERNRQAIAAVEKYFPVKYTEG